jgi:hypothetical protein
MSAEEEGYKVSIMGVLYGVKRNSTLVSEALERAPRERYRRLGVPRRNPVTSECSGGLGLLYRLLSRETNTSVCCRIFSVPKISNGWQCNDLPSIPNSCK